MANLILSQWKMDRLYRMPKSHLYMHDIFEALCAGYSCSLGTQENRQDFLTFEPATSLLANAYAKRHYHNTSYDVEQVISSTIHSLLVYGKAYLYLKIDYPNANDKGKTPEQNVTSIEIVELKGFPARGFGNSNFCERTYDGKIRMVQVDTNALIKLDLKDLGFRRNYFRKIAKKLCRYDVIRSDFVTSGVEGYDFSLHARKNRIHTLKLTKDIGLSLGNDELSDSNILYRKIQVEKLKLCFLQYVVKNINMKLSDCIGKNSGELVAHVKQRDYDQLWSRYSKGDLTLHQLSDILFSRQR